ncbi:CinA family protein [Microbacterium sp. C7(2022)]|uniref:CinA family protein n=1 Tax=Microbacterium sp. C7(2022) TaxID=2992759 RepID=UPI00237A3437|nr:CinA family protein [Microbacterium sp. C7(2022)]MDE0545899.1 CinA family protein [Microbacterium sp. C7(2022)]
MSATLAESALRALQARGWTVGTAESLTGGLVVASLVDVPGASASVRGGIVAYATDVKASALGVDASLLAAHGPVHPDVARQLAEGARSALGVDVGIATTGVAGPEPQGGRAVGTVFVAVVTPEAAAVRELALTGDRAEIRHAAVREALELCVANVPEVPGA